MTKLLIQHGPAKGQKIDNAFEKNNISGVVFSPREEEIESIIKYCNNSEYLNEDNIYIDPQFYYSTYNKEHLKALENQFDFPIEVTRRDWRKKTDRLFNYFDKYVNSIKDLTNNMIVPGFCIDSIDWKFDYSMEIYNYFKERYKFNRYYASLIISSNIFHSKNDIDDILEDLKETIDEKDGIYLIIKYPEEQERKNYESIDPETLSNILYFIYSLNKEKFKIILGYTFLNSILFAMLNCEAVSTGWFNNLRRFDETRFINIETYGRRKKRYVSMPTLTYMPIELISEFKDRIDESILYSNTEYDSVAIEDQDNVSFVDLEQQYWRALWNEIKVINDKESIESKIKYIKERITIARKIYEDILSVTTDKGEVQNRVKMAFKHIDDWQFGIELFEKKASLII